LATALIRRAEVVLPAHRAAEDLHLVGGLVGLGTAQLRRPVRRDQEQRHPAVARLQNGRVQLGDRRTGRRHHRHRNPTRLGQPERKERG
jgi:hypothetical protein